MMQAVFWQVEQLLMSWPVLYELRLQKQQMYNIHRGSQKGVGLNTYVMAQQYKLLSGINMLLF